MATIGGMCMIVRTAKPVIKILCSYNKDNGGYEQPGFVVNKKQFYTQQKNAGNKKKRRHYGMMMFPLAMIK